MLARNESFECIDVPVGDSALFYKLVGRKGAPKWRGPASVPDTSVTGPTVMCQSRTVKVVRYCASKRVDPEDLGKTDWGTVSGVDPEVR